MPKPIYLLVEGMHLRADSIAYDVAFQYRLFKSWGLPVTVFAAKFNERNYPGIDARPLDELRPALQADPGLVIYHWVDGWHDGEQVLLKAKAPVVLRWHNNTPPWFFATYSAVPTHKTVRGYLELLRLADELPEAWVWTNSAFSKRQLELLGIAEERVDIAHPASSYLEAERPESSDDTREPRGNDDPIRLLFVGRVVPHKGHKHLIAAAAVVDAMSGRPVRVILPGRPDDDMERYIPELQALAEQLGVDLDVPGEVSHEALDRAYREADVFVGLSEHEGFGLPILEAMTRRLPVVGYRCTGVAELLDAHPLAVDDLAPVEIARHILAAVEEPARSALVAWQERAVLPRFSSAVIAAQLRDSLTRAGSGPGSVGPPPALEPSEAPPPEIEAALERARSLPAPAVDIPSDLPRDTNPHFVTRLDLEAYRALLRASETGDLRGRALALEFGSHRKNLGGVTGLLKKAMLRMQDGLIRTIQISHDDLESQLQTMSKRVEELSVEIRRRGGRGRGAGSS